MAFTLWTGNEVYLYLTVAFIQMLKAFTPVITMACLFLARLEDPTKSMIFSVFLTAGGTALAAYGEVIRKDACINAPHACPSGYVRNTIWVGATACQYFW